MPWYMRQERLITMVSTAGTLVGWGIALVLFPSPWTVGLCAAYSLALAQSVSRWRRRAEARVQ